MGMGMGGVRGFDLRREGHQVAALSYFESDGARAWLDAGTTPGEADAAATIMALSYLFPWPTTCDSYWLREDAHRERNGLPPLP